MDVSAGQGWFEQCQMTQAGYQAVYIKLYSSYFLTEGVILFKYVFNNNNNKATYLSFLPTQ